MLAQIEIRMDIVEGLVRKARRVAVTYGGEGAKLFEHGELVAAAPAMGTTVVNSVGAGDAFCEALTIGLASGIAPQRAVCAACAVGAVAVADPRSQPLLARLEEYLPVGCARLQASGGIRVRMPFPVCRESTTR